MSLQNRTGPGLSSFHVLVSIIAFRDVVVWIYEDPSFNCETGHDRNLVQLLHNVTHFVPKQTVKQ